MLGRSEEITALYKTERFRFENETGDVIIGDALGIDDQRVTIKGPVDDDGPKPGGTYRFFGSWSNYFNKRTGQQERQFAFRTFVPDTPLGKNGVMHYLQTAPNIGPAMARRLWDAYGADSIATLREHSEEVAQRISGLTLARAQEAAEYLQADKRNAQCTIELMELLDGRGFPQTTIRSAIKRYGNRAASVLRANPYLMMGFRGCGFKRADAMYLDLGKPPEAMKRQALCALHAVAEYCSQSGDTWAFGAVATAALNGAIGSAKVDVQKAILLAAKSGMLEVNYTNEMDGPLDPMGSLMWLSDGRKARNERNLAGYVKKVLLDYCMWPATEEFEGLSDHQDDQLRKAIRASFDEGTGIAILGGSPGTGKTYTVAKYIRWLGKQYNYGKIAIAAPTGKAAVRLNEALAAYDIPVRARTVHSLLEVDSVDGGWTFRHNQYNPLEYSFIIIDEASMLDVDIACKLFSARARGSCIMLVGDINQLAPVGHGAPLRDLIAAGIPYGELREIRRNSGLIVESCASIRDGGECLVANEVNTETGQNLTATGLELLDAIQKFRGNANPIWDCQVLVPVNAKSSVSRKALNTLLQDHLNPEPAIAGIRFRLGDKVVNLKNDWFVSESHEESSDVTVSEDGRRVYVANGEIGKVEAFTPGGMFVSLDSPRRLVRVPLGKLFDNPPKDDDGAELPNTGCNWDLAYALSVHKAQGSEFPIVFVVLDESGAAKRVCDRAWIYTAISRAKKLCVLVGNVAIANQYCKKVTIANRKTFLKELLSSS